MEPNISEMACWTYAFVLSMVDPSKILKCKPGIMFTDLMQELTNGSVDSFFCEVFSYHFLILMCKNKGRGNGQIIKK